MMNFSGACRVAIAAPPLPPCSVLLLFPLLPPALAAEPRREEGPTLALLLLLLLLFLRPSTRLLPRLLGDVTPAPLPCSLDAALGGFDVAPVPALLPLLLVRRAMLAMVLCG